MCFDVPKVVRSPGCYHGHDEESRNGQDMKIDILDDYIRTPEWFRGLSDIYRSTGGLPEPPGGYWASWAQVVEEEMRQEVACGPPCPNPIGKGKGAAVPLLLPSLHLLLPPSPSWNRKGGQNLLGVGLPPLGRTSSSWPAPPPPLLYIHGQGAPHRHNN